MTPSERVDLIKKISKRLEAESWTDIDLTLNQFGLPWSSTWDSSDRYAYCVQHLQDGGDDSLQALGSHLFGTPTGDRTSVAGELPWNHGCFRLFLSHISAEKRLLSEVKLQLVPLGIDAFVAHEDIEPTKEWLEQIELALETCDALAAVLTDGYHESKWTDQEVGFCVSRRVLIIPIRLGIDPYGFISRYQALSPKRDASAIASGVFDILCKHNLTAEKMGPALVSNLSNSESFADAKAKAKLLDLVKTWTPEMLRELEQAVEKNRQVRDSFGVPEIVRGIVKRYGK